MYLDITGYDLLFNHFFNENGATFSTILSEDEINGEANNWTFTGSCSLNKDRFFDTISQNNHNDCPVKLFYNESKYTADGRLEVLMMDSDFLLHVCDALMDEDEDAYVAFTRDKDVNAYFEKVHVVRAIDSVLKNKGKDFLFPVTNKKNKKLLKQCIEEKLETVEESSDDESSDDESSDEESSSDEDSSSDEKKYVIVVTDNTELYAGLTFLKFMRDKVPATTVTDKKTTGISAVKFADAMVIPIASQEPWNQCEISNIFLPSVHEDGVYYVLSGKRWKKTRLTSKHIDVSNHGSSKTPTQTTRSTTTTTTVMSNEAAAEEEEAKKAAEKAAAKKVEEATKATTNVHEISSIVAVNKLCTKGDLYEAGAFDDNEGNTVFTDSQVQQAQEMYRKREAAKKKVEEEARKAAEKAAAKKVGEEKARKSAEAAKKVEEEKAKKAAAANKRKAAQKTGRKKKKKKTWKMPQTVEEIPLWKKRNKTKDFIAKQLSSDGSFTYWIKDKEKRVWEEYTDDNDFMQSYLDMW